MKKILITGSNGLIGEALIERLVKEDEYAIFGVCRSTGNSRINTINLDLNTEWESSQLPPKIDIVIHLAQSENFRNFPESAIEVFNVNTISTLRLLEYARKAGAENFIYASSGGVYGNSDSGFNEEAPLISSKDLGFYLGTKFCSEILVENYSNFFDINILRFFFVYGPKQRKNMLIPRMVESVKVGNPIQLQGECGLKINPIFVTDAVKAIETTMQIKGNNKFNIAGTEILSLKEIANIIGLKLGKKPVFNYDNSKEAKHLIADISKMNKLLCTPQVNFNSGIDFLI